MGLDRIVCMTIIVKINWTLAAPVVGKIGAKQLLTRLIYFKALTCNQERCFLMSSAVDIHTGLIAIKRRDL